MNDLDKFNNDFDKFYKSLYENLIKDNNVEFYGSVPQNILFEHLKKDFDVKFYTDVRGAKYIPNDVNRTVFDVKQVPEKTYLLPIKIFFCFIRFIITKFNCSFYNFFLIFFYNFFFSFFSF